MPFPFIAAAIAGGSALSALGQRFTNRSNFEINRDANLFSARQAQLNRDFQERMSNTSWQRGVADMRAAGINPMLAVSQGGASSPIGNSAQGIAQSNQQNELANLASSAKDALLTDKQLEVMDQQKDMYRQQGNMAGQLANKAMIDSDIAIPKIDSARAQALADIARALNNAKIDGSSYGIPLEIAKRLNVDLASAAQAYKLFKGTYKTGERTEGHTGVTTTYKERTS